MLNGFFGAQRTTAVAGALLSLGTFSAPGATITSTLSGEPYVAQTGVLQVQRDIFRNGGWGYRWISPSDASGYTTGYAPLDFFLASLVPAGSTIDSATLTWSFSGLSAKTDWQRPDSDTALGGNHAHIPYVHGSQTPCSAFPFCSPANMKYFAPNYNFWADNITLEGVSAHSLGNAYGNPSGSLDLLSVWSGDELLTHQIDFTGAVIFNLGRPFFDGEGFNADTEFDVWGHAQVGESAIFNVTYTPPTAPPSVPEPGTYLLVGGPLVGLGLFRRMRRRKASHLGMSKNFAFAFCLFLAVGLRAGPITYAINFQLQSGADITPSGGFSYDAEAPLGSQFSNFIVNWRADTFNLTKSANAPTLLGSGDVPNPCYASANSAGVFQALSNPSACASGGAESWQAQAAATNDEFAWFLVPPLPASSTLFVSEAIWPGSSPTLIDSSGGWKITETPEPSSCITLASCLALWVAFEVVRKFRARFLLAQKTNLS